jgi:hypothetical protein
MTVEKELNEGMRCEPSWPANETAVPPCTGFPVGVEPPDVAVGSACSGATVAVAVVLPVAPLVPAVAVDATGVAVGTLSSGSPPQAISRLTAGRLAADAAPSRSRVLRETFFDSRELNTKRFSYSS